MIILTGNRHYVRFPLTDMRYINGRVVRFPLTDTRYINGRVVRKPPYLCEEVLFNL